MKEKATSSVLIFKAKVKEKEVTTQRVFPNVRLGLLGKCPWGGLNIENS